MKVFQLLGELFGGGNDDAPPKASARTTPRKGNSTIPIPESSRIAVSKAIEQLSFIDRTYGLGIWPSSERKEAWKHDLAVMHAHRDLRSVRLQLLAAERNILYEFTISFAGRGGVRRTMDSARGVELPVIDRRLIADKRVTIQQDGREAAYRQLLKLKWTSAESLRKGPGDAYESEHAKKISGGRQIGLMYAADDVRHLLVVTSAGQRGYGFAKGCLDSGCKLDVEAVFCHAKFAPADLAFQPGQRITAVLVQTPRGLQARSIRAA